MAFHLFEILSKNALAIQNQRFGACLTQFFPWFGSQCELSLKSLLYLYSLSFPIIYFLVYFILVALKSERYIVLLFLYLFLITTHSFFWPLSEIHQGVVLLILYIAIVEKLDFNIRNPILIILSITFIPTIVFLYPLMIISILFYVLFFYSTKERRDSLCVIAFLSLFCFIVKSIFSRGGYDNNSMARIFNSYNISHYFNLASTKQFWTMLWANYYLWVIGFTTTLVYYLRTKNEYKIAILSFFSIAIIVLIHLCYPDGGEPFYLEGQYMQLSFFLGLALTQDIWDKIIPQMKLTLLGIVFIAFSFRLSAVKHQYIDRIDFYQSMIDKYKTEKVILSDSELYRKKLKMTWCSSYEIWLLSTVKNGKTSSIIISDDINRFDWTLDSQNMFLTNWGPTDYKVLNPKYFIFSNTEKYQKKILL